MSKKRSGPAGSNLSFVNKRSQAPKFRLMPKLRQLIKNGPQLAQDFFNSWNLVKLLIALEVVFNYLIIKTVKYTEIDWSTYMVQVGQVFNRTKLNFNYTEIEGPTGPLVYPAGHVYIFYLFKELTDGGINIQAAQYLYLCVYTAQIILVYKIYSHRRTLKVPPYMFIAMCFTSYRIHSIYVLRLFNDPIAILFAYAAFYALLVKRHYMSAILFSIAISIKMNILLFAPAYALVFYEDLGMLRSLKYGSVALATQLVLAAPFLYTNPWGYLVGAFNFGRVFLHEWTVNWRFLDEETFTSPQFFKILLALHVAILFLMFFTRWLNVILPKRFSFNQRRDDPILTLFIANFIGIAFSRSLHYQFYVWYYHSLPMILWATCFNLAEKILILGLIEFSWNIYPSTNFSSILLHVCHFLILIGLFTRHYFRQPPATSSQSTSSKKKRR